MQLEWASAVVEYVNYVFKATTPRGSSKKGIPPLPLRPEVPFLGPRFFPPSYISLQKRSPTPTIEPESAYLKPLTIIHPFYYPELAKCPQCEAGPEKLSWQGWTTGGYREVHGVSREEIALGYQLECKACETRFGGRNAAEKGNYCIATTNAKFWESKEHWEIPR